MLQSAASKGAGVRVLLFPPTAIALKFELALRKFFYHFRGMRLCTRCPHEGPDTDFSVKIRSKRNNTGICKPCKARYNANWYSANKATHVSNVRRNLTTYKRLARELIRAAKDVPCADCKKKYPFYVLQFDHLDPSAKRQAVGRMVQSGVSVATLQAEIAKCEVVCANCHAERTHQRRRSALVA